MKITILFLILFIFLANDLFPQVIIKEKVEIKPQSNQYNPNFPVTTHTITAIMEWDTTGGTHNFLRAKMNLVNECTTETLFSDYNYNGYIELSMNSTDAERYEISTYPEIRDYPSQFT